MEPYVDTIADQGRTFGVYRLDRLVKSSGSVDIYQATYLPKERQVLLYVTSSTATAAEVAAFRTDRAVVLSLAHRNLAPIADFGTIGDQHYVAFQLNGSVPFPAAWQGKEDWAAELSFVAQVAEALAYLHQHGIARGMFAADEVFVGGNTALLVPLGSRRFADFTESVLQEGAPSSDLHQLELLSIAHLLSRGNDEAGEVAGSSAGEGVAGGMLGRTAARSIVDRVRGLGPLKTITSLAEFRKAISDSLPQKVALPVAPLPVEVSSLEPAAELAPAHFDDSETPPERSACQHCGFANTSESRFCAACGNSLDPAFEERAPSARRDVQRQRPLWLTFALSVVTLGLYNFWWFFATWRELRREIRDFSMSPFGHALALVVPIANLFVMYRHFEVINEQLNVVKKSPMLHSGWMIVVFLVSVVFNAVSNITAGGLSWLLFSVAVLIVATLITLGQRAMNGYFRAIPDRNIRVRTHPIEWITLALGLAFMILAAIGTIFGGELSG